MNLAIEFIRNLFIRGNLVFDTFEGFWLGDPSFSGFALDFAVFGFLGFFTLWNIYINIWALENVDHRFYSFILNLLLVHWTLNPGSHLKTHFFFLPLGLFFGSGLQWNLPKNIYFSILSWKTQGNRLIRV